MVSTAPRTQEDIGIAEVTPQRGDEVFGASQVGPFDYVPRVGFREYWYPGVWSKKVGRKPVNLKMLGDELVLFRGKDGNVVALNEWCPHRGARSLTWLLRVQGHGHLPLSRLHLRRDRQVRGRPHRD